MNEENEWDARKPKNKPGSTGTMKRTIRDSVFCNMFNGETAEGRGYLLELDRLLYGEQGVKEEDIVPRNQRPIFVNGAINDVAYSVGDRLVIIEEMTQWSENAPRRTFNYGMQIVDDVDYENGADLHSSAEVSRMKLDLWILYPGRKKLKEIITVSWQSASEDFNTVDVRIRTITASNSSGIANEYIRWSRMIDELVMNKEDAVTADMVLSTIDEAIRLNILKKYLTTHRDEVVKMVIEYSEEELQKRFIETEFQRVKKEGRAEGEERKAREIALKLLDSGYPPEEVSKNTGIPIEEIERMRSQ